MLRELHISNFAIIEHQEISFGEGLNVISGETGSGKSIVLQALDLVLGGRASSRYLRKGTEGWRIQALFNLEGLPTEVLERLPDVARGDELLVSREMNVAGRGKVLINGRLATLALLQETSRNLINICSQGQHVRLLDARSHLELLDHFAGHLDLLERYRVLYESWRGKRLHLGAVQERQEQSLFRRTELEHLIDELESLKLSEGKREKLEQEVTRLASGEHLIQLSQTILGEFDGEHALFERIASLRRLVDELVQIDPELLSVKEMFISAEAELSEVRHAVESYSSSIELDQERLENLREELAELAQAQRKYRTDDRGLLELFSQAQAEILLLTEGEDLEGLREELRRVEEQLQSLAEELTRARKKAAKKLTALVAKELAELNMPDAKLSVPFERVEFRSSGLDQVEMLIQTNKGEDQRPLRQIASGGELSRIMLVLKKILRDRSGVNVLVFDEVDTGVSGGVARAVGVKLRELALDSQVICITHLAQVASLAKHHFLVDKQTKDRTVSVIRELGDEQKVEEIARMLAGYEITSSVRESARELLTS